LERSADYQVGDRGRGAEQPPVIGRTPAVGGTRVNAVVGEHATALQVHQVGVGLADRGSAHEAAILIPGAGPAEPLGYVEGRAAARARDDSEDLAQPGAVMLVELADPRREAAEPVLVGGRR
jgi:hypothetical protein